MDFQSKKRSLLGLNPDIITNLPDNILEQILIRLPIREAVTTSVLSRNWRYKWCNISQLTFSDNSIPYTIEDNDEETDKLELTNFIDRVLLVHKGPIQKFHLSTSILTTPVDCWVLVLSRSGITELVLKFEDKSRYTVPSSLFSCKELHTLELVNCTINAPPHSFKGFSNLKRLALTNIKIKNITLNRLISNCPLLESLRLKDLSGTTYFRICCPNLRYFKIDSIFEDISFGNMPHLSSVSICLALFDEERVLDYKETRHFANVLRCFPAIKQFSAKGLFFQLLRVWDVLDKLPSTFDSLERLSLSMNFEDADDIEMLMCILHLSPNIQRLNIWSRSYQFDFVNRPGSGKECTDYLLDLQSQMERKMEHIRNVQVKNFSGYQSELNVVKYILAKSPMLEKLHIEQSQMVAIPESEQLKTLLKFPHASPKAEIIYLEYEPAFDD